MFKYAFSLTKTTSKNTSSYPISIADIKDKSEYFKLNPTDTSYDSYINNVVIPMVISDWESDTGYILLDRTVQSFVPNLAHMLTEQLNLGFEHLNIREFTNFKYYPTTWDYSAVKSEIKNTNYFIVPESGRQFALFNIKESYAPLEIFQIRNNLECNYKAGFEDNDFTNLDDSVKQALEAQAAMVIDSKTGFCQDFYSTIIAEAYADYSIEKQEVAIV